MSTTRVKLTMFDDYWLDYRVDAHRRWYQPELAATYRDPDYQANVYSAMHYVPEYGKYMLWYEVAPDIFQNGYRLLALAESDDGLHFAPRIVHPERERARQHIVMEHKGVHGSYVLYDPHDADPARRFKYVGMTHISEPGPDGNTPVVMEFSADGLSFTDDRTHILHPYPSDALNSLYYNPCDETYNLVFRAGYVDRRIAVRTSGDMNRWNDPRLLLSPDALHNDEMLQMQYYSMSVDWIDGIFYGLLWRYQTSLGSKMNAKMLGIMEAELVYSYDGQLFLPTTGKPLLTRPAPPQYGCFQQDMMGIVQSADGEKLILYGAGMNILHGIEMIDPEIVQRRGGDTGANVFYTIGTDRFCGLEGFYGESCVITKPLELQSDDLTLNINASAGRARIALLDPATSEPLEGFGYDDCAPFEADSVAWSPRFRDHALAECIGRRVRIGVMLRSAVLHAIRMDAVPSITRPQISFANPMQAAR